MAGEEFLTVQNDYEAITQTDEYVEASADISETVGLLSGEEHIEKNEADSSNGFSDAEYLSKLEPSSLSCQSFSKLKCLARPWDHQKDPEVETATYYDKFCSAFKNYQEDTLEDEAKQWAADMEFLMPAISCCIRRYVDDLPDDDVDEFEERLADWVEFGLSLEIAGRCAVEFARHIRIGCCLARKIFLMRRRQFAKKLAERHILHRLIDIVQSAELSIAQRCGAADSLFASLFHASATVPIFFSQVEVDLAGETCYTRVVHSFVKQLPIRLVLALRPSVAFAGFSYSSLAINEVAKRAAANTFVVTDEPLLNTHLSRLSKHITGAKKFARSLTPYEYRTLYESEILSSLCVIITSTQFTDITRKTCIRILANLVAFDGVDICGPYFLAFFSTKVINLCLKVLRMSESLLGVKCQAISSRFFNVTSLQFALRALNLLDDLALVNQQDIRCIDSERRISILLDMFMLCSNQRSDGAKALITALSFSTNVEHLLEIFTFGQTSYFDKHISDDVKTKLRHTVCYGYACEILLTLARLQTNGIFWRQYGPVICRLIDSNFISTASSLKQWTEPLRDSLAQGTTPSTLHYLMQRIDYCLEKFKDANDPPLSTITTLRLIDALLKEKSDDSLGDPQDETLAQVELFTIFYEENGVQKLSELILLAVDKHSARGSEKGMFLASDALIFEMLLYSAIAIVETAVISMKRHSKYLDTSPVYALLKLYSLFSHDESIRYAALKSKILNIFSLFTASELNKYSSEHDVKMFSFFEQLLECSIHPFTILASTKILNCMLTVYTSSNFISRNHKFVQERSLAKRRWTDILLKHPHHLSFIISSGISSSSQLRDCVTTFCALLAELGQATAKFLTAEFGKFCSRALLAMPISWPDDCFSESDSDDSMKESTRLGEIRFGAAADLTAASVFAFLTQCSQLEKFCYAFLQYVVENPLFVTGILKFFSVASQKTIPHVYFQTQVIVLFKRLCLKTNPIELNPIPLLPRDLFNTLCTALVEHITQNDQSFDTVILSLDALYCISCSSKLSRAAVQEAFVLQPNALMRFACRMEAATDCPIYVLRVALNLLSSTLKDVFSSSKYLFEILQWDSFGSDHKESLCGEHPLLRLCELIKGHAELENLVDVLDIFENMLISLKDPLLLSKAEDEPKDWKTSEEVIFLFNESFDQILDLSVSKSTVEERKFGNCLFGTEFVPPMMQLDLNAYMEEFLKDFDLKFLTQRNNTKIKLLRLRANPKGVRTMKPMNNSDKITLSELSIDYRYLGILCSVAQFAIR